MLNIFILLVVSWELVTLKTLYNLLQPSAKPNFIIFQQSILWPDCRLLCSCGFLMKGHLKYLFLL